MRSSSSGSSGSGGKFIERSTISGWLAIGPCRRVRGRAHKRALSHTRFDQTALLCFHIAARDRRVIDVEATGELALRRQSIGRGRGDRFGCRRDCIRDGEIARLVGSERSGVQSLIVEQTPKPIANRGRSAYRKLTASCCTAVQQDAAVVVFSSMQELGAKPTKAWACMRIQQHRCPIWPSALRAEHRLHHAQARIECKIAWN